MYKTIELAIIGLDKFSSQNLKKDKNVRRIGVKLYQIIFYFETTIKRIYLNI
jgi:hypothetical protein